MTSRPKTIAAQDRLTGAAPEDESDSAVEIMREQHVRRLPVRENGHPVGIVSLGDLAVERDRWFAFDAISISGPGTKGLAINCPALGTLRDGRELQPREAVSRCWGG